MTEAFGKLVSLLDYPMFVVTTRADDEPAGCLVGFASQVSITPPRFLVGLSKRNYTYRVATTSAYCSSPSRAARRTSSGSSSRSPMSAISILAMRPSCG